MEPADRGRSAFAKGMFLFRAVVVAFAVLPFTGTPSGGTTRTPSRTATASPTTKPSSGRIVGILRGGVFCDRAVPGVIVSLGTDDGRTTLTDAGGYFSFSDLAPGTYTLAANVDYCDDQLSLCFYRPMVEAVEGESVSVDLCEVCPDTLHLAPSGGQPGTVVKVVGRCGLLPSNGRVDFFVDDVQVDAMVDPVNGVYQSEFLLPENLHLGSHLIRAESDIDLPPVAFGMFEVVRGQIPCAADCNGDNVVTVDELITALGISLGQSPIGSCVSVDLDHDEEVEIDELVTAVQASIEGCAQELPDLVVSSASFSGCPSPECYDPPDRVPMQLMRIRVENHGNADSGPFFIRRDGEDVERLLLGVGAGGGVCFDVRLSTFGVAVVDPENEVRESNEFNNELSFTIAVPTGCDTTPPPCPTVTPTPSVSSSSPTITPTQTCTPGHDPPPGCQYEGPTRTLTFTRTPSRTPTPTATRGTGTLTPTRTCTPGGNPDPGCSYEGPTFTRTPSRTPTPL